MNSRIPDFRAVACARCRHYQITWDTRLPHGCLAHGFKTHQNPALAVFEASGLQCRLFSQKPPRPRRKTG